MTSSEDLLKQPLMIISKSKKKHEPNKSGKNPKTIGSFGEYIEHTASGFYFIVR